MRLLLLILSITLSTLSLIIQIAILIAQRRAFRLSKKIIESHRMRIERMEALLRVSSDNS